MRKYDTAMMEEKVSEFLGQRREGVCRGFKEMRHHNKARLLHDILCMANNLMEEDGFIIIGVDGNRMICG